VSVSDLDHKGDNPSPQGDFDTDIGQEEDGAEPGNPGCGSFEQSILQSGLVFRAVLLMVEFSVGLASATPKGPGQDD